MKYWSFDNSKALRKYREQRRSTWLMDGANVNRDPEFLKALLQSVKEFFRKK